MRVAGRVRVKILVASSVDSGIKLGEKSHSSNEQNKLGTLSL